jgi:hypothetical protein
MNSWCSVPTLRRYPRIFEFIVAILVKTYEGFHGLALM